MVLIYTLYDQLSHEAKKFDITLSTVIEHYNKLQNVQQIPKLEKKILIRTHVS
jgi:hypothetical protein